jgi:hypothetical protein
MCVSARAEEHHITVRVIWCGMRKDFGHSVALTDCRSPSAQTTASARDHARYTSQLVLDPRTICAPLGVMVTRRGGHVMFIFATHGRHRSQLSLIVSYCR